MKRSLVLGITTLLKEMPINKILNNLVEPQRRLDGLCYAHDLFNKEDFVEAFRLGYSTTEYSQNEAVNIYEILKEVQSKTDFPEFGIFSLIYALANQHLIYGEKDPLCKHEQFVFWREAIHGIGQTPFICAFLAGKDILSGYFRKQFDFGPYVRTDDFHLRQILARGVAENHFHLKGSSPTFLINWVCLMNHTEHRKKDFERLSSKLSTNGNRWNEQYSLHDLARIAASLRLFIWRILQAEGTTPGCRLQSDIYLDPLRKNWSDLQMKINAERSKYVDSLDYTLSTNSFSGVYAAIAGENYFWYRVFYELFRRENLNLYQHMDCIYAYLLIGCIMRSELVQDNKAVGFMNFATYQDRKERFIDEKHFGNYYREFLKIALESSLSMIGMKSLEIRVVPKDTVDKQADAMDRQMAALSTTDENRCKMCEFYDYLLASCKYRYGRCKDKVEKISYVMHITKAEDKHLLDESNDLLPAIIRCRHDSLRSTSVKRKINCISQMRKERLQQAQNIYAIDACASEIGCRPEVFAPSFRSARNVRPDMDNVLSDVKIPLLHITFHVGEDFLDIVDGLRAIDEAIRFLELKNADRIGHALALGIHPRDYYRSKGNRVYLPRHDLLDNVAWLYMSLERFNIDVPDLMFDLRNTFRENYNIIYAANMPSSETDTKFLIIDRENVPSIEMYYDAWKLRGDSPELFKLAYDEDAFKRELKLANILNPGLLQSSSDVAHLRENDRMAQKLYFHYHYNHAVKSEGYKPVEYAITPRYIHAVELLQHEMQKFVARLGISIECNPSSNYLIGTFKDYERHPIFAFNNDGLVHDSASAQLLTSINTDDQGVFDTDLESEYALLVCALRMATDDEGRPRYTPANIYKYVNKLRKIGLDQSFRSLDQSLHMESERVK